jgi:hypothetical protein
MALFENLGSALRLRRRKTFADRVETAAERTADAVRDAYADARASLALALVRSGNAAYRAAYATRPLLPVLSRTTDRTAARARAAYSTSVESLEPVLEKATRIAERAWGRTAKRSTGGLSRVTDLAGGAAASVGASGKAAADAVGGAAAAVASFVGNVLAGLWQLTVFLVKAALLAGVAYAGWQWLQSRREQQEWSTPSYGGAATPSSTYGAVTTGAQAPTTAGR